MQASGSSISRIVSHLQGQSHCHVPVQSESSGRRVQTLHLCCSQILVHVPSAHFPLAKLSLVSEPPCEKGWETLFLAGWPGVQG